MTAALQKMLDAQKKSLTRSQKSMAQKLSKASRYALAGCWINKGWQEQALANLMFVRQNPKGSFLMAMFMVDLGCQGVKDVNIITDLRAQDVQSLLEEALPDGDRVESGVAMAILVKALGFAATFEFEPHKEYIVGAALLRGLQPDARALQTVVVGDGKGKPVYYYGAEEDEATVKADRAKLDAACGPRGYRVKEIPA